MSSPILDDILSLTQEAVDATEHLFNTARQHIVDRVTAGGKLDRNKFEAEQLATHGLAWMATYVKALSQMNSWAECQKVKGAFGDKEKLLLQISFGEYCAQLYGGIPISQVEIVRPHHLGLTSVETETYFQGAVKTLIEANTSQLYMELAMQIENSLDDGNYGALGLDDEMLVMIREQFHRFSEEQIIPHCHEWHLNDTLIPMEIINQMADLGVFGLTIPTEWGGLGMSKIAMCVVTEELARGYIGVGSLGTRSEIAAELIRLGGTDSQKETYLPKIASGEIFPYSPNDVDEI